MSLEVLEANTVETKDCEDSAIFHDQQAPFLLHKYKEKLMIYTRALVPIERIVSYNREFSGMLGDLGLYIPIVVSLAINGKIDLGITLITTGLCNIFTGFVFQVPMPVQPMKSIATAALTKGPNGLANEAQIMAAGLITSFIIGGLGVTNLIEVVNFLIPHAAVRGLQIGLGFNLFLKALQMLPDNQTPTWGESSWLQWDGYLMAMFMLVFAVMTNKSKVVPTAFVMFVIGVIIAAIRMSALKKPFSLSTTEFHVVGISSNDWAKGAINGAIPQVPTTLLNSVIAVVKLNNDLFEKDGKTGVTLQRVAFSVGAMNVLFCWFGGYPMCHGSGGLAGQHRFGARTNLSILVLGLCKLVLGIFFGSGLVQLLRFIPQGTLAILLTVASVELAVAGRSGVMGTMEEARICVLTACLVTFWDQASGILIGIIISYICTLTDLFIGEPEDIAAARVQFKQDVATFKVLAGSSWDRNTSEFGKFFSTKPPDRPHLQEDKEDSGNIDKSDITWVEASGEGEHVEAKVGSSV